MTPEQRRTVGLLMLFAGLFMFIMSVGIISVVTINRAKAADRFHESTEQCMQKLQTLGGSVKQTEDHITWEKADITQGPTRLGEASVVSVLCPGWEMKTACVGKECPNPNAISVTLGPITS